VLWLDTDEPAVAATTPPVTQMVTGQHYFSGTAFSIASQSVNFTYYIPFYVPYTTTFDRIALMTASTFVGTGAVRLGIYNNTNGAPSTVLLDAGIVATTAASTIYTITISQSLSAGVYFLAANSTTAATTNTFNSYTAVSGMIPNNSTGTTSGSFNRGFSQFVNVTSGFATAVSPSFSNASLYGVSLRSA